MDRSADNTSLPGGARTRPASPVFYQVAGLLFALAFFIPLLLMIFANPGDPYDFSFLVLPFAAVIAIIAVYLLFLLSELLPKFGPVGEMVCVAVVLGLLLAAQITLCAGVAAGGAARQPDTYTFAARAATGAGNLGDAFAAQPGETAPLLLYTGLFSLLSALGMADFLPAALAVNLLCIDGGLLLLYLCARRLFGNKSALFALFIALLLPPFLLYGPILCAETLALPLTAGMLLMWLKARSRWRQGSLPGLTGRFAALSALAGVGALLGVFSLALWLAAALDLILLLRGRRRLRALLVGALVLAALLALVLALFSSALLLPAGAGPAAQEPGFFGAARGLGGKLASLFGDGTLDAGDWYARYGGTPAGWTRLVSPLGGGFWLIAYYAFALLAALVFWALRGALKAVLLANSALGFVRLALLLFMLWLLVWGADGRKLLVLLPPLLLCLLEAMPRPAPGQAVEKPPRKSGRAARRGRQTPSPEKEGLAPVAGAAQTQQAGLAAPLDILLPTAGVEPALPPADAAENPDPPGVLPAGAAPAREAGEPAPPEAPIIAAATAWAEVTQPRREEKLSQTEELFALIEQQQGKGDAQPPKEPLGIDAPAVISNTSHFQIISQSDLLDP